MEGGTARLASSQAVALPKWPNRTGTLAGWLKGGGVAASQPRPCQPH